ncbi:hypothetical protein M413DRAFT_9470 [Hebeloma cylindrosporum]|uniref:SEP domain-containing protein n=1 Tax=Hebeloma cylindrosporum TaxID=76867 RepID=A0A0C3CJS3_HEBCY|nr:hypothetical protein M413DRAFT_9470 [Hebeloma cylindrosporum h7]
MSDDLLKATELGATNSQGKLPGDKGVVQGLLKRAAQDGPPPWPVEEGIFFVTFQLCKFLPHPSISEETAIRNLTFWKDGFQFDDGELRRYDDPTQAQILHEINAGRAPPTVLNVRTGQRVELRVAKRTGEDYISSENSKNAKG